MCALVAQLCQSESNQLSVVSLNGIYVLGSLLLLPFRRRVNMTQNNGPAFQTLQVYILSLSLSLSLFINLNPAPSNFSVQSYESFAFSTRSKGIDISSKRLVSNSPKRQIYNGNKFT